MEQHYYIVVLKCSCVMVQWLPQNMVPLLLPKLFFFLDKGCTYTHTRHKKENITSGGKDTTIWQFLNIMHTGWEGFSMAKLSNDDPARLACLSQVQVNAINFWMDKLRNVSQQDACHGILGSMPENWWLPALTRTVLADLLA